VAADVSALRGWKRRYFLNATKRFFLDKYVASWRDTETMRAHNCLLSALQSVIEAYEEKDPNRVGKAWDVKKEMAAVAQAVPGADAVQVYWAKIGQLMLAQSQPGLPDLPHELPAIAQPPAQQNPALQGLQAKVDQLTAAVSALTSNLAMGAPQQPPSNGNSNANPSPPSHNAMSPSQSSAANALAQLIKTPVAQPKKGKGGKSKTGGSKRKASDPLAAEVQQVRVLVHQITCKGQSFDVIA
jgi:hypothetical protein